MFQSGYAAVYLAVQSHGVAAFKHGYTSNRRQADDSSHGGKGNARRASSIQHLCSYGDRSCKVTLSSNRS